MNVSRILTAVMLLTCATTAFAKEAEGVEAPKPLTAEQKLEAAQKLSKATAASAQFWRTRTETTQQLQQAQQRVEQANDAYLDLLESLRKEAGATADCTLNDEQEWQCPEKE